METLNLVKGERLDLTKTNPGLKIAAAALGWDFNAGSSGDFDLDAFAVALKDGKLVSTAPYSVLFFGSPDLEYTLSKQLFGQNVKRPGERGCPKSILGNSLAHSGDNLTGAGDGDDETMIVDFSKLSTDVTEIMVCVNIYSAAERRQNFGMVNNAFVRIYDFDTKQEILKYDLTEDYSSFTGIVAGKLYKKDGEWKFQAVGQGINGDINAIIQSYK